MRDELFDRDYQNGRVELHDGVDRLIQSLADGFSLLHRRAWSAPWRNEGDCAIH